jgi:prepilin-type N-terminal cleavage/methylation domain-containing protein
MIKMKKAFTLAELLAVIAILGIIALVVMPGITNTIKKQKDKIYYDQLSLLISASQNWVSDKNEDEEIYEKLNNISGSCSSNITLTIEDLQRGYNNEYISKDFKNPKTDEEFTDLEVLIYQDKKNYIYCIETEECTDANICCSKMEERLEGCRLN